MRYYTPDSSYINIGAYICSNIYRMLPLDSDEAYQIRNKLLWLISLVRRLDIPKSVVRFEVLTAVKMVMLLFGILRRADSQVGTNFSEQYSVLSSRLLCQLLQNVVTYLRICTASEPRVTMSSRTDYKAKQ